MGRKSPTERGLEYYRSLGYYMARVERQIPHTNTKIDLLGIIDWLGFKDGECIGVQFTNHGNHANHRRKILDKEAKTPLWFSCPGHRLLLTTYGKNSKGKYYRREEEITLKDWQDANRD